MEPSSDDLADTLTATYRHLRGISANLERVLLELWILEILIALIAGFVTYQLLRKVITHGNY